MAIIFGSKKL